MNSMERNMSEYYSDSPKELKSMVERKESKRILKPKFSYGITNTTPSKEVGQDASIM